MGSIFGIPGGNCDSNQPTNKRINVVQSVCRNTKCCSVYVANKCSQKVFSALTAVQMLLSLGCQHPNFEFAVSGMNTSSRIWFEFR